MVGTSDLKKDVVPVVEERRLLGRAATPTIEDDGAQGLGAPMLELSQDVARVLRRVHLLRSCWMVPGIDSYQFSFLVVGVPSPSKYDEVCRLCYRARFPSCADESTSESDVSTHEDP